MKISIITATKNNKEGLLRAIESVRSQTYKNVEHIIVDGLSTDGTEELLRIEIRNQKPDLCLPAERQNRDRNDKAQGEIRLGANHKTDSGSESGITDNNYKLRTNSDELRAISEADTGIYDAINKGIKLATGDVIGLLHSDDTLANEFVLEKVAEAFSQIAKGNANVILSSSKYDNIKNATNDMSSRTNVRDLKISPSGRNDKEPGNNELITKNYELTTIDAVYSDLVYVRSKKREVRGETRDEKRKRDNNESIDHSVPVRRGGLKIEHSVLRNWKTHPSHFDYAQCDTLRITKLILNGWMPPHPTLFVKKEIFEKYGLYRTDMKIAADYEMVLRLFYKHKITTHYLPLTTYCMTIGGASNKSLKNIFIKSSEDYRAMKMHGIPFPLKTLFLKNIRKLPQFFRK